MSKIALLSLITSLLTSSIYPLIIREIDTTKPLDITFSKSHANRITVEDGAIRKIIAPENIFSIRMEEESGQAFIHLIEEQKDKVILSIVTANGFIQDIRIQTEEKAPEIVILKEPYLPTEEEKTDDHPVSQIKSILKKTMPAGYFSYPLNEQECKKIQHLLISPIKLLIGPDEKIIIYEITNPSKKEISLQEKQLKDKQDNWIYLEENQISPKQTTLCIIGKPK